MRLHQLTATLLLLCGAAAAPSLAVACPFCSAPMLTLSEQLNQSHIAVIGSWQSASEGNEETLAETTFAVVQQLAGDAITGEVVIPNYRTGELGDLFLLLANDPAKTQDSTKDSTKDEKPNSDDEPSLDWSGPIEISPATSDYLASAPAYDAPKQERLGYYMNFLEDEDETISIDAYSEFAKAPYEDVVPLAKQMDTAKLRRWLTEDKVTPTRLGLYGMMLGLAGDESDAELMKSIIDEDSDEFRLGIDGIMGGYILLTGESGLQTIEQTKLIPTDIAFSETYAAMQALRFVWQYASDVIEKPRLKQSMRLLLERPEFADLVIADLARWKDWSLIPTIDEYYEKAGYDVPAIQRAIVRYYLAAVRTKNQAPSAQDRTLAKQKLAELKERDPRTYASAERFFFMPIEETTESNAEASAGGASDDASS